jgi:hypothetical protein
MKYCVLYDLTIENEVFGFPTSNVEAAIDMVKEVIGDHINITYSSVEKGEGIVRYDETISHEAVVEANDKEHAREKVLIIIPDAVITDCWVLKTTEEKRILMESL